jgi:hypothetical protein
MEIRIGQGKSLHHYVMLSPRLLGILRSYWSLPTHPVVLMLPLGMCRVGSRQARHRASPRHYVSFLTMSGNAVSPEMLITDRQRLEA